MAKMALLFSHKLTDEQVKDAKENLGITEFVYLPDDLQKKWSNIDPEGKIPYTDTTAKFQNWLIENLDTDHENPDDDHYVLISGDFGMTYKMVHFCLFYDYIPVYATTRREVVEVPSLDGSVVKTTVFKHVQFRRY